MEAPLAKAGMAEAIITVVANMPWQVATLIGSRKSWVLWGKWSGEKLSRTTSKAARSKPSTSLSDSSSEVWGMAWGSARSSATTGRLAEMQPFVKNENVGVNLHVHTRGKYVEIAMYQSMLPKALCRDGEHKFPARACNLS